MKYLLDTNVCIDAMRGRPSVVENLRALSPADCAISTITLFELEAGAHKSQRPDSELAKVRLLSQTIAVEPWDESAASRSAEIRFELERSGMKIGAYDTLIAGHALALKLRLVSAYAGEFGRVEGLELENWREP